MLNQSSLERKEFKIEELSLLKKFDLNNIKIIKSDNLPQLLIWTSELAQYNHAQFIKFSRELELVPEENIEEREEINKKIKFYRNSEFSENKIKDFYLKKLLDQGEAIVKGYIKHPIRKDTKYAVISYHGYNFISFATAEIIEKFPLNFIDFLQEEAPKTLIDIHPDKALLLSSVKDFIKPFTAECKKIIQKNRDIKEHNMIVHEVYKKIKKKEAILIKPIIAPKSIEFDAKSKQEPVVPSEKEVMPKQLVVDKNEKSVSVIKKRKFTLIKD